MDVIYFDWILYLDCSSRKNCGNRVSAFTEKNTYLNLKSKRWLVFYIELHEMHCVFYMLHEINLNMLLLATV